MKNNAEYWEKRILRDKKKAINDEKIIQKQLNKIYKDTFKELEKDIMTLFQRYADDNKLTYSDAIKYLTSKEFSEWRMDLKDYLKEIEKTADPKLLLELNTLAMKSRISRLEQLTYQVNKQLNKCFTYSNEIVKELLEKSVVNSYSDSAKNINYAYGIEATKSIAKERVTKILMEPWSGANFSENIWKNRDKLAGVVRNELTKGIYQGKSSQRICNEISKRMDGSKDDIMRVVRTERSHAVNKAKLEQYKDVGFEYYEYIAAIGQNRTCERCRKVHKESEKEPIELSKAVEGENFPPLHPNCRCTIVPIMKDDEIVEFKEAKTIEEAEKFAIDVLGANYSSYKGCDIKAVNEWNKGLFEQIKKFPKLKDTIGFVGEIGERNIFIKKLHRNRMEKLISKKFPQKEIDLLIENDWKNVSKKFSFKETTYAQSLEPNKNVWYFDARGITFNKRYAKDGLFFEKNLKEDVEQKFHPIGCEKIKSVLDHEMGHKLDELLNISEKIEIQNLRDSMTYEEIKEGLSEYSYKNNNTNRYSEFVAEAYSEYCNNINPREIAQKVGKIIEEEYNKKFGVVLNYE